MRKCEWRGGLPHFVIRCLKRQLRGYLILVDRNQVSLEPGLGRPWGSDVWLSIL